MNGTSWMLQCRRNRVRCDVQISTSLDQTDGRENNDPIHAHGVILGAESQYFRDNLGSSSEITVPGISKDTLERLIDFLYSADLAAVGINDENVFDIWDGAEKLMIQRVRKECDKLIDGLPVRLENCIHLLLYAHHTESTQLFKSTMTFVLANIVQISQRHEFLQMDPKTFYSIVDNSIGPARHDSDDLLRMVVSWLKYNGEEKKSGSMELLSLFSFKDMDQNTLVSILIIETDDKFKLLFFEIIFRAVHGNQSSTVGAQEILRDVEQDQSLLEHTNTSYNLSDDTHNDKSSSVEMPDLLKSPWKISSVLKRQSDNQPLIGLLDDDIDIVTLDDDDERNTLPLMKKRKLYKENHSDTMPEFTTPLEVQIASSTTFVTIDSLIKADATKKTARTMKTEMKQILSNIGNVTIISCASINVGPHHRICDDSWSEEKLQIKICERGIRFCIGHAVTPFKIVELVIPHSCIIGGRTYFSRDSWSYIAFRVKSEMFKWIRDKLGMTNKLIGLDSPTGVTEQYIVLVTEVCSSDQLTQLKKVLEKQTPIFEVNCQQAAGFFNNLGVWSRPLQRN